ncbi:MAG: hypothetical protein NTU41_07085 [Chloroflexi bacterium]|nr:hypothetical protein [Chloroflexota bacterium]
MSELGDVVFLLATRKGLLPHTLNIIRRDVERLSPELKMVCDKLVDVLTEVVAEEVPAERTLPAGRLKTTGPGSP